VPFICLLEVVSASLLVGGKVVREHEGTEGIATLISAVRIKLSSTIISLDVDKGLVDVAGDLDVIRGLDEGHAGDGTLGDDTCTTARLSAPCD
jgi:hypothetical protein